MKKKRPKSGEVYAYYIEELEKYGACQIVKIENKSVYYVSLNCLTDHLPEKEEEPLEILWRRGYGDI